MRSLITLLGVVALAACAPTPRPEPQIVTKEVKVQVPVPCAALADLGPEPIYADTEEALAGAPNIAELAKLYAKGRIQRIKRLAEYGAVKASCVF